jgi:hypothetical protein
VAVLEPGAELRWRGDRVTQAEGDVFYRVEPGAKFQVNTPDGSVEVLGTCFRVSVEPGAGAGEPATGVSVFEGRVRVVAGAGSMDLQAGESARLDARGVQRVERVSTDVPDDPTLGRGFGEPPGGRARGRDPDPLSADVAHLRGELETLKREQAALEARIERARDQLARAGGEAPDKNPYDLTQDDWKALAASGWIKFRLPCAKKDFEMRPELLDRLGLMPEDAAVIERAYAASRERVWNVLRPLCVAALGSEAVVDLLAREGCEVAILEAERRRDRSASDAAMKQVGEMRAGLRPLPRAGEALHPLVEMFLTLTGEHATFEGELAQSLGPEDAHRLMFSNEMCHERLTLGGSEE